MEKVLHAAIVRAINDVGLDVFKRTSMFLSNEKAAQAVKKAA